jgi:hypothetical protein
MTLERRVALQYWKQTLLMSILVMVLAIPAVGQTGDIQVQGLAIGTDIAERTPQGVEEKFDATVGKLYAFTRVVGAEHHTTVHHCWYWGEQLMADVELPVQSASWRTWSSKNIEPHWIGHWKVEIIAENGMILDTVTFAVDDRS